MVNLGTWTFDEMDAVLAEILPYAPSALFGVVGSFSALAFLSRERMPTLWATARAAAMGLGPALIASSWLHYAGYGPPARACAAVALGLLSEVVYAVLFSGALRAALQERVARFVKAWKA